MATVLHLNVKKGALLEDLLEVAAVEVNALEYILPFVLVQLVFAAASAPLVGDAE